MNSRRLPGALICSIHFDTGLTRSARVHQVGEPEGGVGLSHEGFGGLTPDSSLYFSVSVSEPRIVYLVAMSDGLFYH